MIAIPNMDKPKECSHCPCESDTACQLLDSELGGTPLEGIRPDCPLIEMGDIEYQAYQEVKTMLLKKIEDRILYGERRADEGINE